MDDRQLIGSTAPFGENKSGGAYPREGPRPAPKKITARRSGDKTMIKRVHYPSRIYPRMAKIGSGSNTKIAINARFGAELFTRMNDFTTLDNHLREK